MTKKVSGQNACCFNRLDGLRFFVGQSRRFAKRKSLFLPKLQVRDKKGEWQTVIEASESRSGDRRRLSWI
jgi:hypothetical protein